MPLPLPLPGQSGHHAVQFYSDARRLCMSVADFLGDGLAGGQPIIVVATPKHRDGILAELKARLFDVEALTRRGDITTLDVTETLKRFMVNGMPDPAKFAETARTVVERLTRGRSDCVVRAYGEMVDALWRADNPDGAIQLELLWNDLAKTHPFSLLCAYGLGHFYSDADSLQRICECHTHHEILRAGTA
jgi:hypothetical protein